MGPLGTALLALFSVAAVVGLGWWLWSAHRTPLAVGLGLVIGGAVGNLIDRLVYGRVADFFHFYFRATIGMSSTSRTARSLSGWARCCTMRCCGPNTSRSRARQSPGASDAE